MVDRRRVGTDRSPALPFPDPQGDAATRGRCGDAAVIPAPAGRRAKGPKELTLSGPAALVLKLRAAFGVSAKAHVLAFLIAGAEGFGARQGLSVDETARALAYSAVSVRRALQEMVLSGLVTVAPTGPARYATNVPGWTALSGFGPTDLGGRGAKARVCVVFPYGRGPSIRSAGCALRCASSSTSAETRPHGVAGRPGAYAGASTPVRRSSRQARTKARGDAIRRSDGPESITPTLTRGSRRPTRGRGAGFFRKGA